MGNCEICGGEGASLFKSASPSLPDGNGKWYHPLCYAKSTYLESTTLGKPRRPGRNRGNKPPTKRRKTL